MYTLLCFTVLSVSLCYACQSTNNLIAGGEPAAPKGQTGQTFVLCLHDTDWTQDYCALDACPLTSFTDSGTFTTFSACQQIITDETDNSFYRCSNGKGGDPQCMQGSCGSLSLLSTTTFLRFASFSSCDASRFVAKFCLATTSTSPYYQIFPVYDHSTNPTCPTPGTVTVYFFCLAKVYFKS